MSETNRTIAAFGGLRPMARAVQRPVATVQSWKRRQNIPQAQRANVRASAAVLGVAIELPDLLDGAR